MHNLSTTEGIAAALQSVGYIPRRDEVKGLADLLQVDVVASGGSKSLILVLVSLLLQKL